MEFQKTPIESCVIAMDQWYLKAVFRTAQTNSKLTLYKSYLVNLPGVSSDLGYMGMLYGCGACETMPPKCAISSIGITKTTIVLKQVSKALPIRFHTCHWLDKLINPPPKPRHWLRQC